MKDRSPPTTVGIAKRHEMTIHNDPQGLEHDVGTVAGDNSHIDDATIAAAGP
jgi:hypothetical protein